MDQELNTQAVSNLFFLSDPLPLFSLAIALDRHCGSHTVAVAIVPIWSLDGVAIELQFFAVVHNLPVSVHYVVCPVPGQCVVINLKVSTSWC